MFDNKNNSLNNLEPTNTQVNPNISNQPSNITIPSQNLEQSPKEETLQTPSNINQNEAITNKTTLSPQQILVPQPEPASQSVLTPHLESSSPVESSPPIETLQPVEVTDNLMKIEPLPTTLPPSTPLNESNPPEVVPSQNDFSFINELNYVKTIQTPEINPYKDQTSLSSSILKQDITPKNCLKGDKKSNTFQVVTITIVALVLSAFIVATIVFNIRLLRISGTSMSPTITSKDWVVSTAQKEYTYGDIVAFYHKDVIMIKRIIALPGDTVLIDVWGNVYVNGNLVDEPYIKTKALGDPEVEFPYTVRPECYFVLGDNREDSIDSRNIAIRDIKATDIVGKVSYSVIPFKKLK